MAELKADLHLHTCLSPCGELEMTPSSIVKAGLEKGLDIIAVTDHNTAENVRGVQNAAKGTPLTVLAGMEVTTQEEVHIVALFDTAAQALTLQGKVYGHLMPEENNEDLFGIQVIANEEDEVEGIETRLLIGGTTLPLEDAVKAIHDFGGIAIASHIDRESYSLVSQLGFIPDDLELDGLELSFRGDLEQMSAVMGTERFSMICSSDAHRLSEMAQACTIFEMDAPTVDEIRKALNDEAGRRVVRLEVA